jgi:hypothetical protein
MRHALRFSGAAALALAVAAAVGCGGDKPKLVPVTGKVTYKNEPVTAGTITFHPDPANAYTKDSPSSLLQTDGSFTMRTFPFGDGVAPGRYKVTLSPELAGRVGKPDLGYPEKTPWSVEVPDRGLTGHVFEVK